MMFHSHTQTKKNAFTGVIITPVKAPILTNTVTPRALPRHFKSPIQRGAHQPHGPLRLLLALALGLPSFLFLLPPRTNQFDPDEPTDCRRRSPRP